MKITQEMIEAKVVDLMMTGRAPRYVLMDRKSYKSFCNQFRTKMRKPMPQSNQTKMTAMQVTGDCRVEILKVDTAKDLFEVVG